MKKIIITLAIFLGLSSIAISASAQTTKTSPAAPADKAAPAAKPKMDIDSFFKKAEKQTRKAQESGNSNCVPKPRSETPKEPVA